MRRRLRRLTYHLPMAIIVVAILVGIIGGAYVLISGASWSGQLTAH